VDDDLGLTRMLTLNLEQTGRFTVKIENAATGAFAAARDFRPDLIMLDVMMPGMDGGSLAAQLQTSHALKSIPIIFLTAAVQKDEISSRGGHIGGFPYLAKPAALDEVLECIDRHLLK
ncbi:MAG: response regulator, partial [Verrucomicrobiota bacterium]